MLRDGSFNICSEESYYRLESGRSGRMLNAFFFGVLANAYVKTNRLMFSLMHFPLPALLNSKVMAAFCSFFRQYFLSEEVSTN
jgi:hypothetical protein